MKELGEILRSARENKGMSYEEIFETTKIQPRYLQAIEEGNLEIFPGEVYTKGSLRNFARAVGLDDVVIMEKYYQLKGKYEGPYSKDNDRDKKEERPLYTKGEGIWKNMVAGLLVVLLVFGGIKIYQAYFVDEHQAVNLPGDNNVNDSLDDFNSPAEDEDDIEPEEESKEPRIRLVQDKDGRDYVYSLIYGEKIELEVNFTELCWIRLTIDGQETVEGTYQSGQKIEREAAGGFTIRLGNPGGAEIRVNGLDVEL
ncbi:MAG: hypothetical protein CVU88_05500, partial [Firmicutes bacterium HGW-Firmicutes-13]